MALDLSSLPAYTDENKNELIAKAIAGNKTAQILSAAGSFQAGIKSSATINILGSDVIFQADGCGDTVSGTTTLSQRTITVGAIKIAENLCPKDLNGKYLQAELGIGSMSGEEDLPFAELVVNTKIEGIRYELEKADWQGDTAGAGNLSFYDGFIKLIDAAGTAIDGNPTGITTATGITTGNVIGILQGMYALAPTAILGKEGLVLFVGEDVFTTYQQAVFNGNYFHNTSETNNFEIPLAGFPQVKVVGVQGLIGTDRLFLGLTSNFVIGTDMTGEEEEFKTWYSDDQNTYKLRVAFKRGVQVAFPDQIVQFKLV